MRVQNLYRQFLGLPNMISTKRKKSRNNCSQVTNMIDKRSQNRYEQEAVLVRKENAAAKVEKTWTEWNRWLLYHEKRMARKHLFASTNVHEGIAVTKKISNRWSEEHTWLYQQRCVRPDFTKDTAIMIKEQKKTCKHSLQALESELKKSTSQSGAKTRKSVFAICEEETSIRCLFLSSMVFFSFDDLTVTFSLFAMIEVDNTIGRIFFHGDHFESGCLTFRRAYGKFLWRTGEHWLQLFVITVICPFRLVLSLFCLVEKDERHEAYRCQYG